MLCIFLLLIAKFYVLFFIWRRLSTINERLTYLLTYYYQRKTRVEFESVGLYGGWVKDLRLNLIFSLCCELVWVRSDLCDKLTPGTRLAGNCIRRKWTVTCTNFTLVILQTKIIITLK